MKAQLSNDLFAVLSVLWRGDLQCELVYKKPSASKKDVEATVKPLDLASAGESVAEALHARFSREGEPVQGDVLRSAGGSVAEEGEEVEESLGDVGVPEQDAEVSPKETRGPEEKWRPLLTDPVRTSFVHYLDCLRAGVRGKGYGVVITPEEDDFLALLIGYAALLCLHERTAAADMRHFKTRMELAAKAEKVYSLCDIRQRNSVWDCLDFREDGEDHLTRLHFKRNVALAEKKAAEKQKKLGVTGASRGAQGGEREVPPSSFYYLSTLDLSGVAGGDLVGALECLFRDILDYGEARKTLSFPNVIFVMDRARAMELYSNIGIRIKAKGTTVGRVLPLKALVSAVYYSLPEDSSKTGLHQEMLSYNRLDRKEVANLRFASEPSVVTRLFMKTDSKTNERKVRKSLLGVVVANSAYYATEELQEWREILPTQWMVAMIGEPLREDGLERIKHLTPEGQKSVFFCKHASQQLWGKVVPTLGKTEADEQHQWMLQQSMETLSEAWFKDHLVKTPSIWTQEESMAYRRACKRLEEQLDERECNLILYHAHSLRKCFLKSFYSMTELEAVNRREAEAEEAVQAPGMSTLERLEALKARAEDLEEWEGRDTALEICTLLEKAYAQVATSSVAGETLRGLLKEAHDKRVLLVVYGKKDLAMAEALHLRNLLDDASHLDICTRGMARKGDRATKIWDWVIVMGGIRSDTFHPLNYPCFRNLRLVLPEAEADAFTHWCVREQRQMDGEVRKMTEFRAATDPWREVPAKGTSSDMEDLPKGPAKPPQKPELPPEPDLSLDDETYWERFIERRRKMGKFSGVAGDGTAKVCAYLELSENKVLYLTPECRSFYLDAACDEEQVLDPERVLECVSEGDRIYYMPSDEKTRATGTMALKALLEQAESSDSHLKKAMAEVELLRNRLKKASEAVRFQGRGQGDAFYKETLAKWRERFPDVSSVKLMDEGTFKSWCTSIDDALGLSFCPKFEVNLKFLCVALNDWEVLDDPHLFEERFNLLKFAQKQRTRLRNGRLKALDVWSVVSLDEEEVMDNALVNRPIERSRVSQRRNTTVQADGEGTAQ